MKTAGIEITHPGKTMYPEKEITKGEVVGYYDRVAERMLPFLKDRPLTLKRYPDGLKGPGFFQKHAQDYFPGFIERITVKTKDGSAEEIMANNKESLIYLANQGTLEFHVWLSLREQPECPNKVIFDLDPSGTSFEKVKKGARLVREQLQNNGLDPSVMTSGKRGLHVYYTIDPLRDFDTVREEAREQAEKLANSHPDLFTLETRKNKRGDKIFLDILRNAYAQTGICAYSLRAHKEAGVATPLEWSELTRIKGGGHYNFNNIFRRLAAKSR
jgi:bifunctional non-homologous end joining protein LigD